MQLSRKSQGSKNLIYAKCWKLEIVANCFGVKRYRMVEQFATLQGYLKAHNSGIDQQQVYIRINWQEVV